ncbi:Txe/YoeB family addiction module toxin [Levilactobacillus enshiensis]|uniref:Txe/YoeB family addiction module toxin n=1 Tax=Levilactobacillus enshiensis TaxID=2590213 RepID=UPI00117A6A8C|nr:Txe/YoeB family addiction module toxin [Levilactobacillus enshiensis]
MTFKIKIKNSAKADLKKLRASHLQDNFAEIVTQLKRDPYKPNQGFKKLRPPGAGKYSRRLNMQHRVVYSIDNERALVLIWSAWSHYE